MTNTREYVVKLMPSGEVWVEVFADSPLDAVKEAHRRKGYNFPELGTSGDKHSISLYGVELIRKQNIGADDPSKVLYWWEVRLVDKIMEPSHYFASVEAIRKGMYFYGRLSAEAGQSPEQESKQSSEYSDTQNLAPLGSERPGNPTAADYEKIAEHWESKRFQATIAEQYIINAINALDKSGSLSLEQNAKNLKKECNALFEWIRGCDKTISNCRKTANHCLKYFREG